MNVNRRLVLKGMALGSITGFAVSGPVHALTGISTLLSGTSAALPMLVLVNEDAAAAGFLEGVTAGSGSDDLQIRQVGHDLAFVLDFERQLRTRPPMRVIGLLDDAAASVLVDTARSAGARMQWLGQHTVHPDIARHHLLSTDATEECVVQLGHQLRAHCSDSSLHEERQSGQLASRLLTGSIHGDGPLTQWTASLGYLLALAGADRKMAAPLTHAASQPITGSFVSFSIETGRSVTNV